MDDENIDIIAKLALNLTEKQSRNLKSSEVFVRKSEYINIEIKENSIKNSEIGSRYGISVRLIDGKGALGFAFTNMKTKNSLEKMVFNAIKMMNAGTPDPDFVKLPDSTKKYPNVRGIFDKNIKALQIEETSKFIEKMITVCEEDEEAISQSAKFKSHASETYIINSHGVDIYGKETLCSISSEMIVRDQKTKDSSTGFEWQSYRQLDDVNPVLIAENALKMAKNNLNRKKINNMVVPIILTPKGAISIILEPLISAINGEAFLYKRSFLVDKRDELIGNKLLNISDDALLDGSNGSAIFDDEGVPCKNKNIISEGRFLKEGLLHNSYTANKDEAPLTGNAFRSSYKSIPSIDNTNFIMENGTSSLKSMLEDVKKGILLDYTGDSPNIATGDFSGLILYGNIIKNGEIDHPLNETMFGVNLLELYKKISAVSKEFFIYGPYQAPYVKIDDIQIIGNAS